MASRQNRVHFPSGSRAGYNSDRHSSSSSSSSSHRQRTPDTSPDLYVEMTLTPSPTKSRSSSEMFGGQSYHSNTGSADVPAKVAVHLTLASVKHADPSERPFVWDVTQHPNDIRGPKIYGPTLPSPYVIPPEIRKQPALTPVQTGVTISCHRLPWAIHVVAPDGENTVTVEHILRGIYNFLRHPVNGSELQNMYRAQPALKEKVEAAFRARIAHVPENKRSEERSKGIKRVDLLGDIVQFAGLSPGSEEDLLLMHLVPLAP
ncbi:hypothetical protein QCA50_011321 [Cerrena zonata]|uniref:DUF6699 domain-containing protein n=1 Tax=Cerrena zonata TaxID=2478898 RepID=A0AAW0G668_9APHY